MTIHPQQYRATTVAMLFTIMLFPFVALAQANSNNIHFTVSQYYPPLQWLDEQQQPQGFIVELEQALGAQGSFEIQQNLQPWSTALQAVLSGRPMHASK